VFAVWLTKWLWHDQRESGEAPSSFDPRAFHNLVLGTGALSWPVLPSEKEIFISRDFLDK